MVVAQWWLLMAKLAGWSGLLFFAFFYELLSLPFPSLASLASSSSLAQSDDGFLRRLTGWRLATGRWRSLAKMPRVEVECIFLVAELFDFSLIHPKNTTTDASDR